MNKELRISRVSLRVKLLVPLFFILIALFCPQRALAHLAGQPPFFKINNQYANLYSVPLTSLADFPLPQDSAPDNYLVNESIRFELDTTRLPAPPEIIKKTKFLWDFGDGGDGAGLSNSHTYSHIGSYLLTIKADDGTTPTPQLLESALINVLPDKNYPLPKAIIEVNGKGSRDPLTDILIFPLGQSLNFDGSKSKGGIVSYFWDFGDQKSSSKAKDSHYYPGDLTQVFPVLRVKDDKGFISDSFVEVQNANQGNLNTNSSPKPLLKRVATPSQLPLVLGMLGLGILLLMVRWFARGRRRGKH